MPIERPINPEAAAAESRPRSGRRSNSNRPRRRKLTPGVGSYYPEGHGPSAGTSTAGVEVVGGSPPGGPPPGAPPAGGGSNGPPAPRGPAGANPTPRRTGGGRAGSIAKKAGLGALAALAGAVIYDRMQNAMGTSTHQLMAKAIADYQERERQGRMSDLTSQAQNESYRDSIQMNLARVQQNAPDLYMQVAAGRRLPAGAVVLGGTQRQDLLQELGRSMADGNFNQ